MSPITHGLIGWIVSQPLERRRDRILVTAASLLPDLDGLGAIISIDYYSKYHHVFSHNIFFGLLLSILFLIFSKEKLKIMLLSFLSFNSHILGDLFGSGAGWGVPYFWPINKYIFEFSTPFNWELDSWQNLLITFVCLLITLIIAIKRKRTFVEIFSSKLDTKVVNILNKWVKK